MLVLNLPFKALMFLTLMRPSLVLFLVLWLKLVKDFLKVRCRLALLPDRKSGSAGMPRPSSTLFPYTTLFRSSNVPNPDEAVPSFVSGAMAKAGKGLLEGTLQAGTSAVSDKLLDLVGLGGKSAADKGKDTRDYLAAAFPELNAWERAGADASSAGMVDAGFENQKELTKMQLDNQKEIAEMQNETQKEIAGIQSATSRQNTKDQIYAQNEMLAYHQKESTARVASIMENTNLFIQQQFSDIMRQMLTQAQTAGQYFTNDQIKEMTRKVSAEVDLVHQQTQNQRYGSSHIGATAKDISNVVTDAASGVVDIFHGIDKAVADTWNNFWKDGKADGIGSNLSRK